MGLFDLFSNSSAENAASAANAGINQGIGALQNAYGQGQNALTTNYGNASNLYAPLVASTGKGAAAYGDASGANGAAGLQRATQNFENSGQYGAYGFTLGQGLQALDRTHAAAGNLNSGNADTDTLNYATGLAGQQYNNYLTGLNPYLGANASAVSGAAGVDTGLGNASAGLYAGLGNAENSAYTQQGANTAAADMNNYNVGANILNAGLGVAKLATGVTGGGIPGAVGPTSVGGAPLSGGSLFSAFK
jgi:hypothetical protein